MKTTEQTEISIYGEVYEIASDIHYNNYNVKSLLYALETIAIADKNDDILNLVCIAKDFSQKIQELATNLEDKAHKK